MQWPSQSPELSPIELVWDELDRRVKNRSHAQDICGNYEDEYEGEDGIDPGMDVGSILENRDVITPGPSRQSIACEDELKENIDLNVGIPNVEESEDEEILRPVRPSRSSNFRSQNVLESSSESCLSPMRRM
ncbi:unnamed protein product [Euphydryas editha]|uniref:Transposase n=1 Tax=Euphydryas editha TaxID=104508 RepID=A0AAU9TNQ0_EUPED|nr:unnamed protein product [Euphydryas editha]